MPDRTCVTCGAAVHGQGRHLYCSTECGLVDRTCQWCGLTQRVQRKRRDRPFCSQVCAKAHSAEARLRRVTMLCGWCGETMSKRPSEIAKGRGKFCSKRCAGLGRPINGQPSQIATAAINAWMEHAPELCVPEFRIGRWSVDLAFPLRKLAVELDGIYWHSLPAMIEKDARKDAHLQRSGWTVRRIVIDKDATASSLAAEIAAVLARSDYGSTPHGPCPRPADSARAS